MPSLKQIPGPLRLPIIGTLYRHWFGSKISEYHLALCELYNTYGPVVRVQHGPPSATIIHLFDPEHAEAVHSREGKMPYVKPLQATVQFYRKMKDMSPGLGNTNGEEWYRLRSATRQVMLRPQEVHHHLPSVNAVTDSSLKRLKSKRKIDGEVEDLRRELSKWSREGAGLICFGDRLGSMDGGAGEKIADQIIEANRVVFRLSAKFKLSFPYYNYLPTPLWKQLLAAEDLIAGHGRKLVNEAISQLRSDAQKDYHILQYLLGRSDLTDRDVSTVILSLFTDGLSTTVPTLMCCLYCLAAYPKVQEEAYEEARKAVTNGQVSAESLNEIPFIKAFIKEVFRMYPNGVETDRILQNGLEISGYYLPAGTNVTMNQLVHFRSEKYFENPNEFSPQRWIRNASKSSLSNFLLLPFGYGSRSCIGRRFAEQDLLVFLIKCLLNFKLAVPVGSPPLELVYETLLFPKEPLSIIFNDRKL